MKSGKIYLTEFAKTWPQCLKDSPNRQRSSHRRPLLGDWPFTHARASSHSSRVVTQNTPTRFKKALTWPETQSITSLLQVNTKTLKVNTALGVSKIHPPLPPTFACWTPNNPPAGRSRTELWTHASLDGAPPRFWDAGLAWIRPNPGENLATTVLRNRSDINAKTPRWTKLSQDWPKHTTLGTPSPFGCRKVAVAHKIWPNSQKHDRSASKTVPTNSGLLTVPSARRLALHACTRQKPL